MSIFLIYAGTQRGKHQKQNTKLRPIGDQRTIFSTIRNKCSLSQFIQIIKIKGLYMQQYFLITLILMTTLLLSSCAATPDNNLDEDPFNSLGGGGGYLVREVTKGTFEIEGRTNGTLLANYDTAREMWEKQAKKTCPNGYDEVDIKEYTFPQAGTGALTLGFEINQHTVKKGFAVCK
jgi:hypothetical protein